jgi:hypothetical protein
LVEVDLTSPDSVRACLCGTEPIEALVYNAGRIVDGKIWGPRTAARFPAAQPEQCLRPEAVAAAICGLIEQPPSAWTFEMDLRPAAERF